MIKYHYSRVVSDTKRKYMFVNVIFFLNTHMEVRNRIYITICIIPTHIVTKYNLQQLFHNVKIYAKFQEFVPPPPTLYILPMTYLSWKFHPEDML